MQVVINKEVTELYNPNGKNVFSVAVLTQDRNDQYAVYIGGTKRPDTTISTLEMIACSGEKLTYRKALSYFPTLKESEYRR